MKGKAISNNNNSSKSTHDSSGEEGSVTKNIKQERKPKTTKTTTNSGIAKTIEPPKGKIAKALETPKGKIAKTLEPPLKSLETKAVGPNKKRVRSSTGGLGRGSIKDETGLSSGDGGGRIGRAIVEDPTMIIGKDEKQSAKSSQLNLFVQLNTTYHSSPGLKRIPLTDKRSTNPLKIQDLHSILDSTTKLAIGGDEVPNENIFLGVMDCRECGVERSHWMILPEFLSEDLWQRHRYSLSDIRKTCDAFPPRILWQLVISYNRGATNASSRICSDNELSMTFGGKSTAIQKLLSILKELHPEWAQRPSVTWNMSKLDDPNGDHVFYEVADRHSPGLPVHRIKRSTFELLANNVVFWPTIANTVSAVDDAKQNLLSSLHNYFIINNNTKSNVEAGKWGISVTTKITKCIFSWRDISMVALEINKENDLILMGRVVSWPIYVSAHGLPESLRTCPNFILAEDGYYALLDECFYFFAPKEDSNSLPDHSISIKPIFTPISTTTTKQITNTPSKPSLFNSTN